MSTTTASVPGADIQPIKLTKNYMNPRDNLFSANHRNAMMERYNYTDALIATVGELMTQAEAIALSADDF